MDKKTISILGLGVLAVSSLVKNNEKLLVDIRNSEEDNKEFTVPGILLDEFISRRYKISFKYPRSWSKNPRYEDKYEGPTGFFEVSTFSGIGEDIDAAVKQQINETYQPYGSNPTVRNFIVDGQPARVIYPSKDQSAFFKDRDAALVVQYKEPITIDGVPYKYVVIWTNKEYIPLIMSTFKFVND